jgi:integrase
VRLHIISYLGKIKLKDLRPDQIQALYNLKQKNNVGAATIRISHAVLHKSLKQAVKWGLIGRNPADTVTRPREVKREMSVLNLEQVQSLLSFLVGTRFEALYYLALTTGLREGELLGLKWSDLDWVTSRLQVQRQLQRIPHEGLQLVEPKSKAGRRAITLGSQAVEKLRKHNELQQLERQFAGDRWQENDLIFPSTIGTPMEPRNLIRFHDETLEKIGLPPIRFHDLRHTAATLMLKQGTHPKIVQERLGHAQIQLTLDTYSHVLPDMQGEIANRLDELLTPISIPLVSKE